jgi:hypothetical protein
MINKVNDMAGDATIRFCDGAILADSGGEFYQVKN